jgi:hypothetical protein
MGMLFQGVLESSSKKSTHFGVDFLLCIWPSRRDQGSRRVTTWALSKLDNMSFMVSAPNTSIISDRTDSGTRDSSFRLIKSPTGMAGSNPLQVFRDELYYKTPLKAPLRDSSLFDFESLFRILQTSIAVAIHSRH